MIFKDLTETERLIIFQCMQLILESDLLENAEFQTRLGIDRQELRQVIATWPQLDDVNTTSNANVAMNNCLNEVCYGIDVDDDTLQYRYGIHRQTAKQVYDKLRLAQN